MNIKSRAFVSFDGLCQYHCKHCFSYDVVQPDPPRTIEQIVASIQDDHFDVVYVSQKKENFIDPDEGLELCEQIFSRYNCHIVIITRNVFDAEHQSRLKNLYNRMKMHNKHLFAGISLLGLTSSNFSEQITAIPVPEERIQFAVGLYRLGIPSMLLIRPLFPEHIIPLSELKSIVDEVAGNISCVLSGALMVNEGILNRLGLCDSDLKYLEGGESEYLDGAISGSMRFVDVRNEMQQLKEYCNSKGVPFFEHSLPAINYINERHH